MNGFILPSTAAASQRRRAPQIIDAAARVFAERGFHGATTDIANVLGIRQASLYYYFPPRKPHLSWSALRASRASSKPPRRSQPAAEQRGNACLF